MDGWGIAYLDERDALLFRDTGPAHGSPLVGLLAAQRLRSQAVVAHLRLARLGGVAVRNTQPFERELFGRRVVFAHNGMLAGVDALLERSTARFLPIGETDSEVAFCVLLQRLVALGPAASLDARVQAMARFAEEIGPLGPANFVFADDDTVYAHGNRRTQADGTVAAPGLWTLQRTCDPDRPPPPSAGLTLGAVGRQQTVVLFASVPLSEEPWVPLSAGELQVARRGEVVARVIPGA